MNTTSYRAPPVHDGLAIASLVLSLCWLGGLGSLLAVIFAHTSDRDAFRAGRHASPLATAGGIIGVLGLGIAVLLWLALLGGGI